MTTYTAKELYSKTKEELIDIIRGRGIEISALDDMLTTSRLELVTARDRVETVNSIDSDKTTGIIKSFVARVLMELSMNNVAERVDRLIYKREELFKLIVSLIRTRDQENANIRGALDRLQREHSQTEMLKAHKKTKRPDYSQEYLDMIRKNSHTIRA